MGRPIGSLNREKPFNDALRMAMRQRPHSLRRIADRLLDKGEEGDLQSIREIADRLDGKAPQALEVGDVPFDRLTDAQLNAIAAAGLPDTAMMPKALPPLRKFSQG
jgi:hypothetical protein